jgi:DNA polymerase-1
MNKFILIDGTALVFRGFYAIPRLSLSDGTPINAVFGFYHILINLLLHEKPTHFAVCFDRHETTTRKKEFDDYKATRTKAPDELYAQIAPIKDILTQGQLHLVEKPGIEADDIIATIAKANEQTQDLDIQVYSSDLDLIQLVNEHTSILKPGNAKTGNQLITPSKLQEKYGFGPDKIPDYKGLHGDPSDNLPGVKGVGQKTAAKLIQEYGSLENIYNNLDDLTPSLRSKLEADKEQAELCKRLATLHTDIEIPINPEDYEISKINFDAITEKFQDLKFNKLLVKLWNLQKHIKSVEQSKLQGSLF